MTFYLQLLALGVGAAFLSLVVCYVMYRVGFFWRVAGGRPTEGP